MRQKWIAAVCLLCLCLLAACSREDETAAGQETISAYFINKDETRITPVEIALEGDTPEEQIAAVIGVLKENPEDISLWTPISGYEITDWQIKDTLLTVDVNEEYKKIIPTTEVLIRAALVRTLTQISGVESVMFTVSGEAFTDNLGANVGPMTADMFIDNAGKEINAYEMVRLNLYFANETGDALVAITTQPMAYNSNISLEKLVVEQLINGPGENTEDAWPVINPETKVLSVTAKDGVCYVNLDSGFLTQYYNVTADVVIYSVVNSLVELPNINKVQFVVNGETDVIFRENFNLENEYERNLDLVSEY